MISPDKLNEGNNILATLLLTFYVGRAQDTECLNTQNSENNLKFSTSNKLYSPLTPVLIFHFPISFSYIV